MVYDLLRKLQAEGALSKCSITVAHMNSADKTRTIHGRDVVELRADRIKYYGGESGKEILSASLESVLGIEKDGTAIFRRKKRIERIYPRH